jgi:hypothetical protein
VLQARHADVATVDADFLVELQVFGRLFGVSGSHRPSAQRPRDGAEHSASRDTGRACHHA